MDVEAFLQFLKAGGRSPSAAGRAIEYVQLFDEYLTANGVEIDEADPTDLESYVAAVEAEPGVSAKLNLWGLSYYFEYLDDPIMVHIAGSMRRQRVEQAPFRLRQFRGVSQTATDRLASVGISSVEDLLTEAGSPSKRSTLAGRAAVSLADLEDLVRLADLARIPGLKSIRARLYLDAGIRSVEELASWEPDELVTMLRSYVSESGFDGIAPLPREAQHAIGAAQTLPGIVRW